MRIVLINGGFGNQMFQYIFGRYLELETGEQVVYDDSYFYMDFLDGYTHGSTDNNIKTPITTFWIDKIFGKRINSLGNCFTPDVWAYMLKSYFDDLSVLVEADRAAHNNAFGTFLGTNGQQLSKKNIPQQLKDNGLDFTMVAETGDIVFDGDMIWTPANQFNPDLKGMQGNLYYHGYWINKWWFWSHKEILRDEFTFPPFTDDKNLAYERQIRSTTSVAIHIRFFYFDSQRIRMEFYQNAIASFRKRFPRPVFFVFTDNMKGVQKLYKEYGFRPSDKVVYIEGNESAWDNYKDLQLMSQCKHMILSNSSFCYLAYLLNQNPDINVINPTARET